ncbi:hypothetical protein RND81_05G026800 [Saponaria officinalis]|uniref:STAS domain-containing protein n=1 Tax=Saponaria officinalis TaxID=3572 RepID=A0AAW1KTM9_SAPOF
MDSRNVSPSRELGHSNTSPKILQGQLQETFFSDNPYQSVNDNQPKLGRLIFVLQSFFPMIGWAKSYTFSKFRGDLLAGITIASMQVPRDIAYAKLANLPPQYVLYSGFVPPLIYAVMGSSRELAIGPVAVVPLMMGTLLQKEFDPFKQANEYRRITQAAIGFLRMGFLVDFLSHAATVGFMAGAAIVIALQQLKSFWQWDLLTIAVAASFLVFLMVAKYIGKRYIKLFWVSAIAPLVSLILSTLFVYISHADKHGVQIVGYIPKGLNLSSVDEIYIAGTYIAKGFKIGDVVGIITLAEALAIARTFADIRGYELNGNQEMVVQGVSNIVGSFTSFIAVTPPFRITTHFYMHAEGFSRSAVNYMAGCQTTVSNIVMSCIVLLTLEVITPLFKYIPNAILASIIISAVLGLIDIPEIVQIWKIDKFDFIACMGAFLGKFAQIYLSFGKIIFRVTRPQTALLGKIPGCSEYRNVQQFSEATMIPVKTYLYCNFSKQAKMSNFLDKEVKIMKWLSEEENKLAESNLPKIKYLIIDMSYIDTGGTHALEKLYKSLQKKNIKLIIGSPGQFVIDKFYASGLINLIGEDNIFTSLTKAIDICAPTITQEA